MNQVTNKIPYGLLTEEEQAQFCDEAKNRGMYEIFNDPWQDEESDDYFSVHFTYRLKMVEGEKYYCESEGGLFHLYERGESNSINDAITIYSRSLNLKEGSE